MPQMGRSSKARKLKTGKNGNRIQSSNPSPLVTVHNMGQMILNTGGVTLCTAGPLTYFHCDQLMKALVVFVATNPPSVAANLFKVDQLTDVNPWNIYGTDPKTKRNRNWQCVYAIVYDSIAGKLPSWLGRSELLLRLSQKSNAVITGEVMQEYKIKEKSFLPEKMKLTALVVGFWVAKLYSVSVYRASPEDLPEPIRETYFMFLRWKGEHWGSQVPALEFKDDEFLTREEIMSCFPFAKELTDSSSSNSSTLSEQYIYETLLSYEQMFETLCTIFGETCLTEYISTFKGSLLDFYLSKFKVEAKSGIALEKLYQVVISFDRKRTKSKASTAAIKILASIR